MFGAVPPHQYAFTAWCRLKEHRDNFYSKDERDVGVIQRLTVKSGNWLGPNPWRVPKFPGGRDWKVKGRMKYVQWSLVTTCMQ
jgi:hypothetical protein